MNLLGFLLALSLLSPAWAQVLPQNSPAAEVHQVIGLTEINAVYHRPSVKGRKVWGSLVPYGIVWRTGANEATVISFSDDVTVNDLRVKAGDYALFTIPARSGEWTVILNKNVKSWGTTGFKDEDNVLTIRCKPRKIPLHETFEIEFENIGRSSGEMIISWERVAIPITIKVEVDRKANENIDAAIRVAGDNWRVYANCADYCLRNNIRLGEAQQWVDKALQLESKNFFPFWLKADLLALEGNFAESVKLAEKSLALGLAEQGEKFLYKKEIEESISFWKAKLQ
jgi:Protein of unknown function (DUF2911)